MVSMVMAAVVMMGAERARAHVISVADHFSRECCWCFFCCCCLSVVVVIKFPKELSELDATPVGRFIA